MEAFRLWKAEQGEVVLRVEGQWSWGVEGRLQAGKLLPQSEKQGGGGEREAWRRGWIRARLRGLWPGGAGGAIRR